MSDSLFLPVISGTSRPANQTIHVATFIHRVMQKQAGVTTQLVKPEDFNLPYDGNDDAVKDPTYSELTAKADGFFIVVPEYNHSFPGSLKRLLDSELKNYIHKPVAFAGVSSGPWGGVRGVESLVNVVRELGLVATFTDVQFPSVGKLFDEQGNILDEKYEGRVQKAIDELLWMARVLKKGRSED